MTSPRMTSDDITNDIRWHHQEWNQMTSPTKNDTRWHHQLSDIRWHHQPRMTSMTSPTKNDIRWHQMTSDDIRRNTNVWLIVAKQYIYIDTYRIFSSAIHNNALGLEYWYIVCQITYRTIALLSSISSGHGLCMCKYLWKVVLFQMLQLRAQFGVHFGFPGNVDGPAVTKKRVICHTCSQEMPYKNTSNLYIILQ